MRGWLMLWKNYWRISMSENKNRGPLVWKVVLVVFPALLALSVGIALYLEISGSVDREVAELEYQAGDFDAGSLKDSTVKLRDFIGERDFESEDGQKRMQMAVALVQGTLGPNNLGYEVREGESFRRGGRIWKNYWVDSSSGAERGVVVVCSYSNQQTGVAACLSVAEWMRGREFSRAVRVIFLAGDEAVGRMSVGEEAEILVVGELGGGTAGVNFFEREVAGRRVWQAAPEGGSFPRDEEVGWVAFEEQVEAVCQKISELAGEK